MNIVDEPLGLMVSLQCSGQDANPHYAAPGDTEYERLFDLRVKVAALEQPTLAAHYGIFYAPEPHLIILRA